MELRICDPPLAPAEQKPLNKADYKSAALKFGITDPQQRLAGMLKIKT
jgi:hypothetical protein